VPSLFIDGEWVASGDGTCSQVVNPSDATVVTEVDVATEETQNTGKAMDEYREAKHIWQNTAPGSTGWFGG